jgi:hypothetical protein
MRECFANLERNDGFGGDSSPSRDDPCRRALRPIDRPRPLSATSAKRRHQTVAGEPRRTWRSRLSPQAASHGNHQPLTAFT